MWGPGDSLCLPHFSNCTQIRQLTLPATPQLMSLLECTGSLLESIFLSFNTFEGYEKTLDGIEQNCKNLKHVTLHDSRLVVKSFGENDMRHFCGQDVHKETIRYICGSLLVKELTCLCELATLLTRKHVV